MTARPFWRSPVVFGGIFVFIVTQIVYLLTLTISCPFWDSGEYIATSYILGVPHPPGTPLYVLIGRIFSLVPLFELVATRVNYLSALASSLAAVFMYSITVEIYRMRRRHLAGWPRVPAGGRVGSAAPPSASPAETSSAPGPDAGGERVSDNLDRDLTGVWIGVFAGVVSAFFTAFGRTFWENAIEAEVYALSSMIMGLSVWLILVWSRERGERARKTGLFVALYYVLCLAMGIHLGTFLVLPAIALFALLVDRRIFGSGWVAAFGTAGLLVVLHPGLLPTLGYEIWVPLLGAAALCAAALHRSWPRPVRGVWVGAFVALLAVLYLRGGLAHTWLSGLWPVLLLAVVAALVLGGRTWGAAGPRGLLTWCVLAAVLGISTHVFLIIRAGLDPAINEADPSTFDAFWKVLIRDQYKPPNPFTVRQAPWDIQFTRHFWEYARDQYSLGIRPTWVGWYLPYVMGLAGAILHAVRERRSFVLLFAIYLITSIGLVFYLNFRVEEVRERDYFFVASFQFFTVWIGLGIAFLLEQFRTAVIEERGRSAERLVLVAGIVCVLLPVLTLKEYWHEHDRTRFHVAEDYAYNMLQPLEPNALLFTNGDNDTFPLWYIQEVRGFRKDVRVVNVSLLNTDWYLRQLRDYEPSVDLGWSDREIDHAVDFSLARAMFHAGYPEMNRRNFEQFLRETGLRPYVRSLELPLITKDVATARIIERESGERPIYIAVTVPDLMGLEERLVMQGLVFRLEEAVPGETERIDLDATLHNLDEVYRYRGVIDEDGTHDWDVFKPSNARRMMQNYGAAYIRSAETLLEREGGEAEILRIVDRARAITPRSRPILSSLGLICLRAGAFARAEEIFAGLVDLGYRDPRTYRFLGRSQEIQEKLAEAELSYRRAYAADLGQFESMRDLFSYLWEVTQKKAEAVRVLEEWLQRHPGDERVQPVLEEYRDSLAYLMQGSRTEYPPLDTGEEP